MKCRLLLTFVALSGLISGQARGEFIPLAPDQLQSLTEYLNSPEHYADQQPYAILECGIIASYSEESTIRDRAMPMVEAAARLKEGASRKANGPDDDDHEISPEKMWPLSTFYNEQSADFFLGLTFAYTLNRIRDELRRDNKVDPLAANTAFRERNCMYLSLE